ncbi:putative porphobilinogen synthase [Helianthus anomalus]
MNALKCDMCYIGFIMNDETMHQLCKQAVSQARAGADVVSPSDMMDGRVGAIRSALLTLKVSNMCLLCPILQMYLQWRQYKSYQMNTANYREALIELCADESEWADILLVKPCLLYLDVVRLLRDNSSLLIVAYQVIISSNVHITCYVSPRLQP